MPKELAGHLSSLTAIFSLNIDSFGLPLQCVNLSSMRCTSAGVGWPAC